MKNSCSNSAQKSLSELSLFFYAEKVTGRDGREVNFFALRL